jgi:hypothetical protein
MPKYYPGLRDILLDCNITGTRHYININYIKSKGNEKKREGFQCKNINSNIHYKYIHDMSRTRLPIPEQGEQL